MIQNDREYPRRPLVGVGALVIHEGRVLLVKRGIEPSKGIWAIPGGLLELGETLRQGAEREIREETGLVIRAGEPLYTFDFCERDHLGKVRYHFVIVDFEAVYLSGELMSGGDAAEARWLAPEDLKSLPVSKNTLTLLARAGFTGEGKGTS